MTSILDEGAEKLLPCPFCGSDNLRFVLHGYDRSYACQHCGAHGPTSMSKGDMPYGSSEFIAAWNRRSPSTDIPAPLPGSGEPVAWVRQSTLDRLAALTEQGDHGANNCQLANKRFDGIGCSVPLYASPANPAETQAVEMGE